MAIDSLSRAEIVAKPGRLPLVEPIALGEISLRIGGDALKWAFSEAAALMIRSSPEANAFMEKMTRQRGKARAVALVAAKIGRVAYWIMKRKQPFDAQQFWKNSLPKGMPTVEGAAMTP